MRLRAGIIGVTAQKAVPHMQVGDVLLDDHTQHIVGFVQEFLQMLGAFRIDGF